MIIGGFQKFSLIDYPEKISAVVFTQGCNFRCPYCHNPELVGMGQACLPPACPVGRDRQVRFPTKEIFSFLKKRRGKLDAVVVTGGEPTLQKGLSPFLKEVKKMGFLTKLDTNGSRPDVIKKIIDGRLADYMAMDIKAPLEKYHLVSVSGIELNNIQQSIKLIMNSGVNYEFRTTVLKSLLDKKDILKIGGLVKGAKLYVLQKFVSSKSLDPACLGGSTYSDEEFERLRATLGGSVERCLVR